MDMSLPLPPPSFLSIGMAISVYLVWTGPVGLFVLRKHLRNARGLRWIVKAILTTMTALTAPAAASMLLVVVAGTGDAAGVLWSLLRNSW